VYLCIFASMLLFSFAFYIQSQLGAAPDTIQKWSIIAKSIAASAAGTGFIAYAIAWLRRIYLDDISVERSLERYALDVDRASWSIETLMEMAKQENAEIPEAWIKGVCNDLFVTSTEKEEPTALQALGAMMDVAAGAEIGSNGAKIVLNRKGTKAIADSAK
ncbi:MAG: hypothetical protein KGN33_18840, partial [Paracoccaceae bacterium]|nr:hypothetical protein [Paracoccaceae bacterium]